MLLLAKLRRLTLVLSIWKIVIYLKIMIRLGKIYKMILLKCKPSSFNKYSKFVYKKL